MIKVPRTLDLTGPLLAAIVLFSNGCSAPAPPKAAAATETGRNYHLSRIYSNRLEERREAAADLNQHHRVRLLGRPDVDLGEDPDWTMDPFEDRSWRWALHAFTWLDDLMAVALADSDTTSLATARDLIADWANDNLLDSRADMAWHDHASAIRAGRLLSFGALAARQGQAWTGSPSSLEEILAVHAERLAEPSFYSRHTNHGFDQAKTLLLLGLHLNHPKSEAWRTLGTARLNDEIAFAFTNDGVHRENSASYHSHLTHLLFSIRAIDEAYGLQNRELDGLISRALRFAAAEVQPDGYLPMIGDTSGDQKLHFTLPDWVEGREEIRYGLAAGREGRAPTAPDLILPESGYVIFRDEGNGDGGVHMVVKGAALSTYHYHDDVQSFTLWAAGERWIVDGGLYKYDYADPLRTHLAGRRAHNVVLVDDGDTSVPKAVIPSTFVEAAGGRHVAHCTSDFTLSDGVRSVRTLVFLKPSRILITDRISATDGRELNCRQIFHVDRDKDVTTIDDGFLIRSRQPDGIDLKILCADAAPWRVRGQEHPWLQGWAAYEAGTAVPIDVVGFERRGVEVEFLTVLEFVRPASP